MLEEYFWSDRDNTFLAFVYAEGGLIKVNPSLSDGERHRAQNTIDLTGLDRTSPSDPEARNRRLESRRWTWMMAIDARQDLATEDTANLRKWIVNTATSRGFWSVWMTVFADNQDMLRRLIDAFPGTSKDCFDDECRPIHRSGGAL